MVPSAGLGIFVSSNAGDGGIGVRQIVPAFFDEFLPPSDAYPHPLPVDDESEADITAFAKYAGSYRGNRRSYTTWEKVLQLGADLNISTSPAGGVVLPGLPGKFQRFIPSATEGLFQSVDDPDVVISFREDENGSVTHAFMVPYMAFEKLGALESGTTHQLILGLGLLIFVFVVLGSIKRTNSILALPKGEKLARASVFIASLLNIVFVVALVSVVASGIDTLLFTGLPGATILLSIPFIAALFSVWSIVQLRAVWGESFWTRWAYRAV